MAALQAEVRWQHLPGMHVLAAKREDGKLSKRSAQLREGGLRDRQPL